MILLVIRNLNPGKDLCNGKILFFRGTTSSNADGVVPLGAEGGRQYKI